MTGLEVKTWREARGISQTQLAKLLPMPLATLQGWERAEPRGAPPPFMRRALNDVARDLLGSRGALADGTVSVDDISKTPTLWTDEHAGEGYPPQSTAHLEDQGPMSTDAHELDYVEGDEPA